MKLVSALLLTLFLSTHCCAQKLDQSITELANDLSQKVTKKQKVKLALTDFVNSEGKVDALTEYIREELEMKLINNENNLQVIDRKHIKLLLSEHHLQSEGLIDESTAKSAISFIKIDGWIVAEITSIGDQIKIKVTVTDISTSQIYAASTSGLISDVAIKNLLEPPIKVCSECGGRGTVQVLTTCSGCGGKGSNLCSECNGTGHRSTPSFGSYPVCETCNGIGTFVCKICKGNGKTVSYQTCLKCGGKVTLSGDSPPGSLICDGCSGTGKIKVQMVCSVCSGMGYIVGYYNKQPCKNCAGKGQVVITEVCAKCNGKGKL